MIFWPKTFGQKKIFTFLEKLDDEKIDLAKMPLTQKHRGSKIFGLKIFCPNKKNHWQWNCPGGTFSIISDGNKQITASGATDNNLQVEKKMLP